MKNHAKRAVSLIPGLAALLLCITNVFADHHEKTDNDDVTLFRGAADNSYYALYFNALPAPGAENVVMETHAVDLRPERDVTVHVEVFNPKGTIPLIVTPGGMGDTDGFRGFARNVAAAAPELKVFIWDRRNVGRSEVSFGTEPLTVEEGEDLHVLIQRLGVAPATLYGMSSGARSNMILASRYPEDVAALVIAPLTGGPIAAVRLAEEYYLKYLSDENLATMAHVTKTPLTSMEDVAKTPLWSAYMARNPQELKARFLRQDIADFRAAMKRSGEHLRSYRHKTALGMTDEQLAGLKIPATLILHHGDETDELHPIPMARAATTLIQNSTFEIAPHLEPVLDVLLPFVKQHTPALGSVPSSNL